MAYRIVTMPSAHVDLEECTDFIGKDSKVQAQRWLRKAWNVIFSLAENPHRFAVIDEAVELRSEVRDVLHYSHRILFRIDDASQTVEILRIWHTARRPLKDIDLR